MHARSPSHSPAIPSVRYSRHKHLDSYPLFEQYHPYSHPYSIASHDAPPTHHQSSRLHTRLQTPPQLRRGATRTLRTLRIAPPLARRTLHTPRAAAWPMGSTAAITPRPRNVDAETLFCRARLTPLTWIPCCRSHDVDDDDDDDGCWCWSKITQEFRTRNASCKVFFEKNEERCACEE